MKIGFHLVFNQIDISYHYPLGFSYLKSYTERNSDITFEAVLINSEQEVYANKDMDIFCISFHSQDFDDAKRIISNLKKGKPDIIVIMGGQHITHFPNTLPETVDIGVFGEGEITFLELMRLYSTDKRFDKQKLPSIKGLIFRDKSGNFIKTEPRPLIENMDSIGLPDRNFYPKDKRPYLFTARGCPYKCTFCSPAEFWKKVRYFSAEYIYEDLKEILKLYPDIQFFGIWDDLFVSDRNRLRKLRDLLHKNKIFTRYDFQMACQVRSHLIDEELCHLLHTLRITAVSFGFESVTDNILKLLKPDTSVQKNLAALDMLKKYNISVCCSFIIGVPGETEDDIKYTFELILKLIEEGKLDEPHVNILMPMPNTVFWRQAEEKGIINVNNMDWSKLRYFCNYRDTIFDTPEQWAQARLNNKSIYLNEDFLKEERLLELIIEYEKKIEKLRRIKLSQRGPAYNGFVHVDASNPNNAHSFILNGIENNSTVLECGSSGGHFTKALAKKNCKVDCIEKDRTVANMAYHYSENIFMNDLDDENFLKSLPLKTYDYIVLSDVLQQLKNPDRCLTEIKETLKDDGKILISIPNIAHGSVRLKLLKGHFESTFIDKNNLHFYEFNSIITLLNQTGFYIEHIDMVRVPVEHEQSGVNIDEFDTSIVDEIKKDLTAVVFQYIVTATKINGRETENDPDELYNKFFGPKPDIFIRKKIIDNTIDTENIASEKKNGKKSIKERIKCILIKK